MKKVQKAANCFIAGLRKLSYKDRSQLTGLFPEAYGRAPGDIICIRRVIRGGLGRVSG